MELRYRKQDGEKLRRVKEAADAIPVAVRALHEAVAEARAGGASYGDIGATLGISRQAAWERFRKPPAGPPVEPIVITAPSETAGSAVLAEPTVPAELVEPAEPTELVEPAEPAEPAEPTEPAEPSAQAG